MEATVTRAALAALGQDADFLEVSIRSIVARVSAERYGGNVYADITSSPRGNSRSVRLRFVLRCHSSSGEGARRSASGRRTVAATWEAHEHCIRALFDHWGETLRVATALATYNGPEDFERKYADTYDAPAGSLMAPVSFGAL